MNARKIDKMKKKLGVQLHKKKLISKYYQIPVIDETSDTILEYWNCSFLCFNSMDTELFWMGEEKKN